jgi:uncharacterized protein YdeI (YjbR/CyaY-like superfamily)
MTTRTIPMGKRDPRVDAYIERAQPFARPILKHLRKMVHGACPHVQETMKWSFPHFDYKGIFCAMAGFRQHCTFGFWKGALLRDSVKGMPAGGEKAMGQFGRIASLADLPNEKTLVRIVKAAAKLNDERVAVPRRKPKAKPPLKVPPYFSAALRRSEKARAAFDAFPPSHRREYVEWVAEAKTGETRSKRLATAIEWISQGKGRNWKYERPK